MNHKLNINRLLENSKRSDVLGYNIYTRGKKNIKRPEDKDSVLEKWDAPIPGLCGIAAIGHEIDKRDLILPVFSVNGSTLDFRAIRNRWTPAFMDTYYRCQPFGEYKKSGLVALREKKCFTGNDTFVSHLTISNDGREPITIDIALLLPFDKISDGIYSVEAKIIPNSLKKSMMLTGFAVAKTDFGDTATVTVPPNGSIKLRYGFAFSRISAKNANRALSDALELADPFLDSERRFNEWMDANAPRLEIENTDILKIYYYRFFVIKSAIHTPSDRWIVVFTLHRIFSFGMVESPLLLLPWNPC